MDRLGLVNLQVQARKKRVRGLRLVPTRVVSAIEGSNSTTADAPVDEDVLAWTKAYRAENSTAITRDETLKSNAQSALQWKCVETQVEGERLHYGRFAVSPFRSGQANTVGVSMQKALLGEVEGAAVSCATFKNVKSEYAAMKGVEETPMDILVNLKELVIRSDSDEPQKAIISAIGPGPVTAGDIVLPPSLEVTDPTQHIAYLTKEVSLDIELDVEKGCGYRMGDHTKSGDGRFYIDSVFMPVRNANYSVHSYESEPDVTQEILFLEIWTNGSITPEEALHEAARCLIDLFLPFLHPKKKEVTNSATKMHKSFTMSQFNSSAEMSAKEVDLRHVYVDQLRIPSKAYNSLKRANINTVSDLLDYTQDDLLSIPNFGRKSVDDILEALQAQFSIDLPENNPLCN